jgi:hypothetical protein
MILSDFRFIHICFTEIQIKTQSNITIDMLYLKEANTFNGSLNYDKFYT